MQTLQADDWRKIHEEQIPYQELPHTFDNFFHDEVWHAEIPGVIANKSFGPAEPSMREGLLHAQEVSFNTARGHSPEAIKAGIRKYIMETFDAEDQHYFLQEAMLQGMVPASNAPFVYAVDRYFTERIHVYPIFSTYFDHLLGLLPFDPRSVSMRKQMAYQHYASYLRTKYGADKLITLGFSDDTPSNVKAIREQIGCKLFQDPDHCPDTFAQYQNFYPVFYVTKHPNIIEKTRYPERTKMDVIKALTAQQGK